jgi:hypothetical protein
MVGCFRISKFTCFNAYFCCCSGDTLTPYIATVIDILQLLAQEKWSWMALPWLLEYQGGNHAERVWSNPVRCRVFIDSFLLLWMLTPSSMSTISVLLPSQDREKRLSMASFRPIQNQVEYPEWAGSHMVHLHHLIHIMLWLWLLTHSSPVQTNFPSTVKGSQ